MRATVNPAPSYDRLSTLEERLAALDAMDPTDTVFIACGKCGGSGYIAGFGHVLNGVCFDCAGSKGTRRTVKRERANVKAAIRREAKAREVAEVRRAEADEARAAWVAANPDVHEAIMRYADEQGGLGAGHGFMENMLAAFTYRGQLTEAQTEAVRRGIAKRAERAAADAQAEPVPTGRVVVTGEVVKVDVRYNQYGEVEKMLVRDDRGFRVWGTVPRAIGPERGDRVTFTATLEPSDDDPAFGFFSRPAKAEVLEEVAQAA